VVKNIPGPGSLWCMAATTACRRKREQEAGVQRGGGGRPGSVYEARERRCVAGHGRGGGLAVVT
jgi:hypothetical protein